LNDYLQLSGKAIFIAGGFGDEQGPSIEHEIRSLVLNHSWSADLILTTHKSAEGNT
jgi:hypothetical protein